MKQSGLPFSNLKHIADLINYDGPILCHVQNEKDENWFSYWVDESESSYFWLMLKISVWDLTKYLNKEISLYNLILQNKEKYIMEIINDEYKNIQRLEDNTILIEKKYLPDKTFYHIGSLMDKYENIFMNIITNEKSLNEKGFLYGEGIKNNSYKKYIKNTIRTNSLLPVGA